MKFIFELLTSPLSLPIAWYLEYLIIWIVSRVAYKVAFSMVGDLYDDGIISGRTAGHILHWIIRLIFFVVCWAAIYGLIVAVKWIIANYILVLCILGGILVLATIITLTIIIAKIRA